MGDPATGRSGDRVACPEPVACPDLATRRPRCVPRAGTTCTGGLVSQIWTASDRVQRPTGPNESPPRAWVRPVPGHDPARIGPRTAIRVHERIACRKGRQDRPASPPVHTPPARRRPRSSASAYPAPRRAPPDRTAPPDRPTEPPHRTARPYARSSSRSMARRMKRAASALLPPRRSPSSCSSARVRSPR